MTDPALIASQTPPAAVPRVGGYVTALAVIVANMVGTGVFTSLGFQVMGTRTGFALLMIWAVGGVVALCGALSYGELGAAMPRSGGEYRYLARIFHPAVGLLAGWVSVTVGFAAPIALAAMALGKYAALLTGWSETVVAVAALALVTLVHATHLAFGRVFQVVTTAAKIALIVGFIVLGVATPAQSGLSFAPTVAALRELADPAFAVSLIYVSYAFSGWNAASYMAGEIEDPQRTLPRVLLHGTALVTAMYLALNWTFLRTVPLPALAGKLEVGALSATAMVGARGGALMSGMLCILLLSTVSAMAFAGPRIIHAVAEDLPALGALARRTRGGVPRNAVLLQQIIALGFVLTGSFERVVSYAGFTLNLFTLVTVIGVYVLRRREPALARPYRTWGYPVTPAVFIALSIWTLFFVLREKPLESLAGLATVALGGILLLFERRAAPTAPAS